MQISLFTLKPPTEARDDTAVNDKDREEIAQDYLDPDSLSLNQMLHMDRTDNVIDLAYKDRFRYWFL